MGTGERLAAGGLLWVLATASATGSEGEIEYRQHTMAAVGGHLQAAVDILRQKVPHTDHMPVHANALAELSELAPALFPKSSAGGDALPDIWENPEDFAKRLDSFQSAASAFADAVETGGDVGGAFQKLGQACKGCHDNYRAE